MEVILARIGRAHGLRGEVALELRTDRADLRFVPGTVFSTDPPGAGPLTLRGLRTAQNGVLAAFQEAGDRTAAEALRGTLLLADVDPAEEAEAWYPAQLKGLPVELPDGTAVGQVSGLVALPAQDLLEIAQPDGTTALVPLVKALVPVVDVAAGRIVIDPPTGLVAARPDPDQAQDDQPGQPQEAGQ
ncbi:MAG: ribosome maturation factor RimM [Bifidobacteriaceae bacterium]|jgi:16S rRNA processing protein RimM|nr:ribosome maturation factor RimM [Bifidobacteriaceae bacterium]